MNRPDTSRVWTAVGVAVCLALWSACSPARVGAAAILRPLRIPILGKPTLAHRTVTVQTDDGLRLEGWLFSPADANAKGLVVLLHGKDINRQHFLGNAERLVKRGFAVLAYDHRAHGSSEGTFLTYGAREVPDLQRFLDAVEVRPVFLVGESLGAAVALQAAARDERVRGVAAGAPFSDLATIVDEHAPFFFSTDVRREAIAEAEQEAGFRIADISPARDAERITVPVLLLHGSEDTFIPLEHSLRIYQRLKSPRQLVKLPGVGHADILLHDESWRSIEAFLEAVAAGRIPASPEHAPKPAHSPDTAPPAPYATP